MLGRLSEKEIGIPESDDFAFACLGTTLYRNEEDLRRRREPFEPLTDEVLARLNQLRAKHIEMSRKRSRPRKRKPKKARPAKAPRFRDAPALETPAQKHKRLAREIEELTAQMRAARGR